MPLTKKQLDEHFDKVVKEFAGDMTVLESALGAFAVGQLVGWRVLLLVHSRATFNRYQKILELNFRDYMPERGKYAHKSHALMIADKVGDFWKVATGALPGRTSKVESVDSPST
jgi:hypothetical protein